jgi:sugar phosphate isomerase/epimerase
MLTQSTRAAFAQTSGKPDSNYAGVQVGIIAPYAFRGTANTVDDILQAMLELGLSAVEMQAEPVEAYAGAPVQRRGRGGRRGPERGPQPGGAPTQDVSAPAAGERSQRPNDRRRRGGRRGPLSAAEVAARRAAGEEMRKWRLAQPMDKFEEVRRKYNGAGVSIDIVKFGLGPEMTDEEIDYCFQVAKTLGCGAITCEPPVSETRRLGQFAEKHQIRLGYHNHSDATGVESFCRPGAWEQAFFYSRWNGANVDVGHFCAGNSTSPVDFLRMYPERITNLHLKDRKFNQGPNMPWGQGDTPLADILRLMKRQQYKFMATIELEYPIPDGSDVMSELRKCVEFCKQALA